LILEVIRLGNEMCRLYMLYCTHVRVPIECRFPYIPFQPRDNKWQSQQMAESTNGRVNKWQSQQMAFSRGYRLLLLVALYLNMLVHSMHIRCVAILSFSMISPQFLLYFYSHSRISNHVTHRHYYPVFSSHFFVLISIVCILLTLFIHYLFLLVKQFT